MSISVLEGKAEEQKEEYECGHENVLPILLFYESMDGEGDPGDGKGNKEKKAELHDPTALEPQCMRCNQADGAHFGGFPREASIGGNMATLAEKDYQSSDKNHCARDDDSYSKQ